ncbi:MAG: QueT transporter family protein [Clostridiales bacterium]|nr:QueT transporter family protein [Clostridiales bacterium]
MKTASPWLSPRALATSGIIAALYVALTLLFAPISYGQIQLRISEALTLLPVISRASIPGLFVGCFISNIFGGSLIDAVFGSLASLLAAILTRRFRQNLWLAALMPVVVNAVVISLVLWYTSALSPLISFLTVGAGQAVVCYLLGVPLAKLVQGRGMELI